MVLAKPRYSCFEVTEYIASQLKKGVCNERLKAVHFKEHEGGIAINFQKDTTRAKAAFNAQYQLWPNHILEQLFYVKELRMLDFSRTYVYGMMHHSVGTERAVKEEVT